MKWKKDKGIYASKKKEKKPNSKMLIYQFCLAESFAFLVVPYLFSLILFYLKTIFCPF